VAVRADRRYPGFFFFEERGMDAACLDLAVRMTSPAYESGFCLIMKFASKLSLRMFIRGKISMALRAGKRVVDGGFELFFVNICLDEFVVFERHDGSVFRMTGQTGFCLLRDASVFRACGEGGQQSQGKKKQRSKYGVLSFFHMTPCLVLGFPTSSSTEMPEDMKTFKNCFFPRFHHERLYASGSPYI
jgi:hypothetical protein